MNFKDRFNNMIEFIEHNVKASKSDIMYLVAEQYAFGSPAYLNNAFDYITGMKLSEYVLRRKLINAVKYKNDIGCTIEEAALEFNFSAASNYMTKFKERFNTTVDKMTKEEFELEITPLRIETILEMSENMPMINQVTSQEPQLFDVPVSQLNRIKQALGLMEYYDFKDSEAETAYQLTKSLSFNIKTIFRFCSDYFEHIDCVEKRYKNVKVENLAILCIKTGVCVRQGVEMMLVIDENCKIEDYNKIPNEAWNIIKDENQSFDYESHPDLVMYVFERMKETGIPFSEYRDVFEHLNLFEDVDECIEDYLGNNIDFEDIFGEQETDNILEKIANEYSEIEATYTDEFLGF